MPENNTFDCSAKKYVEGLIQKARKAQQKASSFSQEKVDELSTAIAWCIVKKDNARELAKFALEETRMGDYDSKFLKIQKKIKGVQRDIKNAKTVGVIDSNESTGITKIAKPVGVIGAIIPCTNPTITPVIKAMNAIKGRNALICSPHASPKTFASIKKWHTNRLKHGFDPTWQIHETFAELMVQERKTPESTDLPHNVVNYAQRVFSDRNVVSKLAMEKILVGV